jgi:hypothetical protein
MSIGCSSLYFVIIKLIVKLKASNLAFRPDTPMAVEIKPGIDDIP